MERQNTTWETKEKACSTFTALSLGDCLTTYAIALLKSRFSALVGACLLFFALSISRLIIDAGIWNGLVLPAGTQAEKNATKTDWIQTTMSAPPRICGVSAIMGTYEKTIKEPKGGLDPSVPLFMLTDQERLLNSTAPSAWTLVRADPGLWQEDCKRFEGARNNPCNNTNPFNLAKFFKEQFYRVPAVQEAGCNVVVWFDGDVQIVRPSFMGELEDRARRGQNFVVFVHQIKEREGLIGKEMNGSKFSRYFSEMLSGLPQPWQPVDKQYEHFLAEGFREKWFVKNGKMYREAYGMFVTCMVMFDLRQPITKKFLDCWWEENLYWTTQDQLSFPFCAWKLGVYLHDLPDAEISGIAVNNQGYKKVGHGKRI